MTNIDEIKELMKMEVYYHGVVQEEYSSPMLSLLNYADMITGPTGERTTLQERMEEIAQRYGKGSMQESVAKKMADWLEQEYKSN